MHHVQGGVHGADVAEGSQIAGAVAYDIAGGEDAGKRFVGDADEGVFFVVFEEDVVAGFVRLDLGRFQDQGFLLGGGEDVVDIGDVSDQGVELPSAVVARLLEIGTHPAAQTFGLADVDDLGIPVLHQVDARAGRQGVEFKAQVLGEGLFHLPGQRVNKVFPR